MDPLLTVGQLHFSRSHFTLSIPSLQLFEGDRLAIIGHNGSGKTTLLHILCGLESSHRGEISLLGKNPHKNWKELIPHFSLCMQNPDEQLFCENVKEDLLFAPHNFRLNETDDEIIDRLDRYFNIRPFLDRPSFALSYGEKRKIVLAVALATHPKILFLDEPFAMLDNKQKKELISLLKMIQPLPFILVTHELSLIEPICNKLLILQKGAVQYFGDLSILKDEEFLTSVDCL